MFCCVLSDILPNLYAHEKGYVINIHSFLGLNPQKLLGLELIDSKMKGVSKYMYTHIVAFYKYMEQGN